MPDLVCVVILPSPRQAADVVTALGDAETRVTASEVTASWPAGRELVAIRAARSAVRCAEDARAGIHEGGRDPEAVARALALAAPPGSVRVSKSVERFVPRQFRFTELPMVDVAGEAVLPYDVEEELGAPGEFGAAGPLVGRDADVARLLDLSRGGARLVLTAPPGTGRARLLRAVRDAARAASPEAWIAVGRCPSSPPAPFGAFGDLMRAEAAASGHDRWDGERLVAAAKRLGGVVADEADAIALSLGARLTDHDLPTRIAPKAWKRLVQGATILCIEDLEHAAKEERALLESLDRGGVSVFATAVPGTPIPRGFREEKLAAVTPRPFTRLASQFRSFPPDLRDTLAAAAVLGRSSWRFAIERLLAADAAEPLAAARKAGWLLVREGSLMGDDGEHLFPHALHRAAALDLTPPEALGRFHATAAQMYSQRAQLAGPAASALAEWHQREATGHSSR